MSETKNEITRSGNRNDRSGGAELAPLTPDVLTERIEFIRRVVTSVMKEGVHYARLPNCDKPTLLRAGVEVLFMTFHLGTRLHVERVPDGGDIIYRVVAEVFRLADGVAIGHGVGCASTAEPKWAWRVAVCDDEYDATPENRRRTVWRRHGGAVHLLKQVRVEPAAVENTVLKMAAKRARTDACHAVLGTSAFLTQDVEELAENGVLDAVVTPASSRRAPEVEIASNIGRSQGDVPQPSPTQTASQTKGETVTRAQCALLHARLARGVGKEWTPEQREQRLRVELQARAGVERLADCPWRVFDGLLAWADGKEPSAAQEAAGRNPMGD